jgi:DNA-binding transcriptional ArsR family regulator
MPDAEMAALLRAVLDDVCADLAPSETATRERVAARLSDLVRSGRCSVNDLRRAGRDALIRAPTMWP